MSFSAFAQSTPNPDAPPPVRQDDGPMKVLDAPPRKQEPQGPPKPIDRLRLGGSIGPLSFGNVTSVGISPVAGFQATERLSLGGGISYTYTGIRYGTYKASYNNYGGRGFAMFNAFQNINLNAEFERLNVEYVDYNASASGITRRKWLNSTMIGASYSTPTGGRFARAFNLMILYNLNFNSLVNPTNAQENIYPTGSPLVIRAVLF